MATAPDASPTSPTVPSSRFPAPIREFFTLRRAEDAIRAYQPEQHDRVRAHFEAAERRLFAGRRLGMNPAHTVSVAILLRAGVQHYLFALDAARAGAGRSTGAGLLELAETMPELPPSPADVGRAVVGMTDDARVRAALGSPDPLYLDRLSPEDIERTRWALDRAASMLRRRVEPRTLAHVRRVRWARASAAIVALVVALVGGIHKAVAPVDIALGKPVHASSLHVNPPDGHELVDGDLGTGFGVHTNVEDNANVIIDLVDAYRVTTVKVYNRVDGWFDDILPVVAEVSLDGTTYKEIGRREEHFGTRPPWIVDARSPGAPKGEPARYVRLRVPRRGYIALSEVEVFGTKM